MKCKGWVIGIILFALLLWGEVRANEKDILKFGIFITKSDDAWNEQQLGKSFSPEGEKVLMLTLPEKLIVLYRDKQSLRVYLSVFRHGKEEILWETDDIPPSELVAKPILVAGVLNANSIPDILICYSIDCGIGSSSECWEQEIRFSFDGQNVIEESIPLSAVDMNIGDRPEDSWDNRWNRLVMIVSASENSPCMIYVWSQRYRSEDQPLDATERMYTYQIVEYQVKENQLVKVETTEGSRLQTSELLRSILWTRREQGNEPLLLNFERSPYLVNENTWFNVFTYRE
jgi:hypothetical protein